MRRNVAAALQAAGVAAVTVAGFLVAAPLGFLAGGAGLLAFGLAMEKT